MTMNEVATMESYGVLIEPATLRIERLLPGPIERVWSFLTENDQRRKWLAAGDMPLRVGGEFELVWRNAELNDEPTERPDSFPEEHRMASRITEIEPPRRLAFTWGSTGGVTFDLEERGEQVLLTLTHHRVPDRATLLNVSAGWHAHLDTLVARASDQAPAPFWPTWSRLKEEYDARLPA
jgi:uncharacterized protein YndB with AHSA1/START domain